MTLTLHEHPFAAYCWKALIALYERDVPFEPRVIADAADRARLAELWPMASIPVLVDDVAGVTLPESTPIVEYLDALGEAPRLIPADAAAALQARLWDRVIDAYVMTPMQKIVGDSLRPGGRRPTRRALRRPGRRSRRPTSCSTCTWLATGPRDQSSPSPTAPPRRRGFTRASSTAGTSSDSPA